jgi:glutathione S-transferase
LKLFWSARSPFARKAAIAAYETGQYPNLERAETVVTSALRDTKLLDKNPLSKLPTLVTDDGEAVFDSRVICEYFDSLHNGPKLFPAEPEARLTALIWQALGDGIMDFLLLWRAELRRPEDHRLQTLIGAYETKLRLSLDRLESEAGALAAAPFGIGHITVGCALAYLDFRFDWTSWRTGRPNLAAWFETFAARPSAQTTAFADDV